MTTGRRNQTRTVLVLASIVVGMAGLSFAAVPLYDLFCRVTGYGGTTQVDDTGGAARSVLDRVITVRFNADVNDALPWTFEPVAHTMDLRVGMDALAYYRAESVSAVTTAGTSTFNVTPCESRPGILSSWTVSASPNRPSPVARPRIWRFRSTSIHRYRTTPT